MKKYIAPIVQKLAGRQQAMAYTDEQFAELLGIGRNTWRLTRTGHVPLGISLLKGVTIQFPELDEDVLTAIAEYEPSGRAAVTAG